MGKISLRKVNTALGPIEYQLELKRVKNINLRIKSDGGVYVSASPYVSSAVVDSFIIRKADFIIAAQRRFAARPVNKIPEIEFKDGDIIFILNRRYGIIVMESRRNAAFIDGDSIIIKAREPDNRALRERIFAKLFDKLCMEEFSRVMEEIYPIFEVKGVAVPELKIRNMKSRWGSCMPGKGIITINKKLLCAPEECIKYVVMHEYCHFIHPDHSPAFHALMTELMPDWKVRKKLLARCSQYWF